MAPERSDPRFFLSYRREDAPAHAGRLADHLLTRFGAGSVFMDVDSIEAGADFVSEIGQAISKADAVLVVIGPAWLETSDASGARRLDDPGDFVRAEIGSAFTSGVRVMPVLVGGASMPSADRLPEQMAALARLNAIELLDRRWREDVEALVDVLERRVATCPRCGRENPDDAAFCMACGAPLQVPSSGREVRKVATIVVAGLAITASGGGSIDPEALRAGKGRAFDSVRGAAERHGGIVQKPATDTITAVFGVPVLHEDDADRAVRAAVAMREVVEQLAGELNQSHSLDVGLRVGVATGEVLVGGGLADQAQVTGDVEAGAADLMRSAGMGEIRLAHATERLVRDAVTVEPAAAGGFRLVRVADVSAAPSRRMDSPMIGRHRELVALRSAFERSASDRACQLFTVLAPAGTGKSRLVEESLRGLDGATVLRGRCLPYGDGITYFPILEIVKQASGLADFDAPEVVEEKVRRVLEGDEQQQVVWDRVSQLLGLATPGSGEETFWAVRRFLEAVAGRGPLVVILDDIHWGEPALLELVEHIAEWSRDVPILLVCMARPELLDLRPTWGGGKLNASTISLEPLSEEECVELIANLLSATEVPPDVSERIAEVAGGNPLFVEEMLAMLVDVDLLTRRDGRWAPSGDLSRIEVPPTISALLGARLDLLPVDERRVLEASAVIGKEFILGAVCELVPEELREAVLGHLMTLVRKELLRPDRSAVLGHDAFSFRHLLIRDAAYEAIPKGARADLHERAADWLERVAGDRIAEQEEVVGHHLEQAFRYREALNPRDLAAAELAERAGMALAASGRRAYARGDMRASAKLLGRAADLLPAGHEARLQLLPALADALTEGGSETRAIELLDDALGAVGETEDPTSLAHLRLARLGLGNEVGGPSWAEQVEGVARRATDVFSDAGDDAGLAIAWRMLGFMAWGRGEVAGAIDAWKRSSEHASSSGERSKAALDVAWQLIGHTYGRTPVPDALALALTAGAEVGDFPAAKVEVLWTVAILQAMAGAADLADAAWKESQTIARELGREWSGTYFGPQVRELILRLAGDLPAAIAALRDGQDAFERLTGEPSQMTEALLALALAERGDDAEAWTTAQRARTIEDVHPHVEPLLLRAEALVLAHRGESADAERMARDAVSKLRETEFVWLGADALMTLGDVLLQAGKSADAAASIQEALGIYGAKGIRPFVERARALKDEIGTG